MLRKLFCVLALLSLILKGDKLYAGKLQGKALVDSLLATLPTLKDDTNKVNVLNKLAFAYSDLNADTGLIYSEQSLRLSEKLKWQPGIARAYTNLGMNYYEKGKYDVAESYYLKAESLTKEMGNNSNLSYIYNGMAMIHYMQGHYPRTLELFNEALKQCMLSGDTNRMATIQSNIAAIYIEQGDIQKAKEYMLQAYRNEYRNGDKKALSSTLSNIGMCYTYLNELDSAIYYIQEGITICESLGIKKNLSTYYLNLAEVYNRQNKLDKALDYFELSLKMFGETNDTADMTLVLYNIATVYYKQKNYNAAINYVRQSLDMAMRHGLLVDMMHAYEFLSSLYKEKGQYQKALDAYEQYVVYKDSIFNKENSDKMTRLEVKAEYDKKHITDSLKHTETLKLAAIKARQQRNLIIIGILVIAAGIILIIRSNKRKQARLEDEKNRANENLLRSQEKLHDFTKNIQDKNRLLERLEQRLDEYKSTEDVSRYQDILAELRNTTILTDEDWEQFRNTFEKVHVGYLFRLKEQYPSLTPAEIRYIVLAKLDMTNKEMASVLGVGAGSIRTLKSRLIKKMSFEEEDELSAMIASI